MADNGGKRAYEDFRVHFSDGIQDNSMKSIIPIIKKNMGER